MRIGLQTWGSEGDIRPFAALATHLAAHGHGVKLVVTGVDETDFGKYATGRGFELIQTSHVKFDNVEEFTRNLVYRISPARQMKILLDETFFPFVEEMADHAGRMAKDCDVLVGHNFMYPLFDAAEAAGKPCASVTFCHGIIPTEHRAIVPFMAPYINFSRWLNRQSWRLAQWVADRLLLERINLSRKRFGLAPRGRFTFEGFFSKRLNLIAASPQMVPPTPDWGPEHQVCGFFNLPQTTMNEKPSDEVMEFIQAGPPPVYMTFGSLTQFDLDRTAALMVQTALKGDFRAIIQLDWDKLQTPQPESPKIFRIGKAPHAAIFPHCACVAHHGGSGTSQATALAGVPSAPVPIIFDQPYWALTLHRMGVAPSPLHFRLATPARAARVINRVMADDVMRRRAQEVAAAMRRENGVEVARLRLEALAGA